MDLHSQLGKAGALWEAPRVWEDLWPVKPRLFLALEVGVGGGGEAGVGGSTNGPGLWVELAPAPGLHFKAEPVTPSREIISAS